MLVLSEEKQIMGYRYQLFKFEYRYVCNCSICVFEEKMFDFYCCDILRIDF